MSDFGLRMDMKAIKSKFMDRKAVLNRFDKAAARVLSRVGALTRTRARRSMRPGGKKAKVSQFDDSLKKVLGELRDEKGRFKKTDTLDIKPWPVISSKPGEAPRTRSRQLKDKIFFAADSSHRSVVTGPQIQRDSDVPELLEFGGLSESDESEWVKFWSNGNRVIRLVAKGKARIRLKARPYMGPAHDAAVESLIPGIWQNAL